MTVERSKRRSLLALTLINGADYMCDYFVHIGKDELLNLVTE